MDKKSFSSKSETSFDTWEELHTENNKWNHDPKNEIKNIYKPASLIQPRKTKQITKWQSDSLSL